MNKVKSARVINKYLSAPLWKRFIAYLIDILAINVVLMIPFSGYLKKFGSDFSFFLNASDSGLTKLTFFIIFAYLFYFTFLEYKIKQTLGKIIMNIYVVSLAGKNMSFSQAFIRNITKPFSIVLLVDVSYMFFKGGRQRLFEVFSKTAVVSREIIIK